MSTQNSEDFIAIFRGYSYRLDKNASETKATRFVACLETTQEKLYWYNQYSGILTSSSAFIFPCGLSDGTIGVMIWRTRDTRPVNNCLKCLSNCYDELKSWMREKQVYYKESKKNLQARMHQ